MSKFFTQKHAKSKDPINGPFLIGKYINSSTKVEYKCKCGKIFQCKPNRIWTKNVKSCGHCNDPQIGQIFSRLTVEKVYPSTRHGCRVKCSCSCIKGDTIFKGNGYWIGSLHRLLNGVTKSCGCLSKESSQKNGKNLESHKKASKKLWTGTKDISGRHIYTIKNNAKKRNIEFILSKEYLQELLEKQNYMCALTGLSIKCGRSPDKNYSTYEEQTASLDRIDSSKGYIKDNVQWIHKDINKIKQNFSEKQLIDYCRLILNYYDKRI